MAAVPARVWARPFDRHDTDNFGLGPGTQAVGEGTEVCLGRRRSFGLDYSNLQPARS